MPRRKKQWWKPRIKTESIKSTFALLLILSGILLGTAQLGSLLGAENTLSEYASSLFGLSSVLLIILLIVLGLNFTKIKHPIAQPRTLWGLIITIFGLITITGSLFKSSAGWVGSQIVTFLSANITIFGSFLTGITIFMIGILILFNTNLNELIAFLQPVLILFRNLFQSISGSIKNLIESKQNKTPTESTKEDIVFINKNTDSPAETQPINNTKSQIEIVDDTKPGPAVNQNTTSDSSDEASTAKVPIPYTPPPLTILHEKEQTVTDQSIIEKNAQTIESTLSNFGIQARIAEVNLGPAITQYAINLAEGTRSNKILSLQNDLALSLASPTGSVRIEAPIPGKRLIGIEVPNMNPSIVRLKPMLESQKMAADTSPLAVALGEDVSGQPIISHINKWPHIIIAGATGSGKSVLIHAIINSILFRAKPEEVNFIMIDPKRVELTQYNNIPHLRTPVIVDVDKTISAFKWAVGEMEKRYRLFQQLGARNLQDFNEITDTEKLPYILLIVDELADLMVFAGNEMETLITRIAQKARATGIFMVLSTQRPSVDVITGLIKANIPTRIALNVSSSTDSRVILDMVGAEKLLGKGDMLYLPPDAGKPKRIQGVFLSNEEISQITQYMDQFTPYYKILEQKEPAKIETATTTTTQSQSSITDFGSNQDEPDDDKFYDAVRVIINNDKASASLLQRKLKIGYARAARILDELEEKGLVSPPDGSNPRDVNKEAAKEIIADTPQSNSDDMVLY